MNKKVSMLTNPTLTHYLTGCYFVITNLYHIITVVSFVNVEDLVSNSIKGHCGPFLPPPPPQKKIETTIHITFVCCHMKM